VDDGNRSHNLLPRGRGGGVLRDGERIDQQSVRLLTPSAQSVSVLVSKSTQVLAHTPHKRAHLAFRLVLLLLLPGWPPTSRAFPSSAHDADSEGRRACLTRGIAGTHHNPGTDDVHLNCPPSWLDWSLTERRSVSGHNHSNLVMLGRCRDVQSANWVFLPKLVKARRLAPLGAVQPHLPHVTTADTAGHKVMQGVGGFQVHTSNEMQSTQRLSS